MSFGGSAPFNLQDVATIAENQELYCGVVFEQVPLAASEAVRFQLLNQTKQLTAVITYMEILMNAARAIQARAYSPALSPIGPVPPAAFKQAQAGQWDIGSWDYMIFDLFEVQVVNGGGNKAAGGRNSGMFGLVQLDSSTDLPVTGGKLEFKTRLQSNVPYAMPRPISLPPNTDLELQGLISEAAITDKMSIYIEWIEV